MLSIGESISSNAQLNQNGGNLHVSENAQIQGSAALLIGPNDEFTGADLAVSGNGASITVTTPITSRNLFVGGFGNFTYQQPKDETSGVSVDGNLWVSVTLGTPTLQFEFDDNANTGLHWGIRVFGNQQTEMQDYLDDGLIVTSGTSEQVQVIYDPTPYGEYTYLGFLVGDSILLGDVNCDGFVNLLDIQPFVNLLSSGGFVEKADINQDGLVNLLDVQPFVDVLAGN